MYWRSRQETLRSLLECAKDLADVPSDVDTTLTSIVTRAQQLLDCDLAYLSLNDPARQGTYVRVMVGATSMEWKELLIPYGVGVVGMVADTAAPATRTTSPMTASFTPPRSMRRHAPRTRSPSSGYL